VRQKSFDEMMTEAAESWLLDIEGAKIDFALGLNKLMERNCISRSDLAVRLKVSLPMITKILRGDTNLTIETMVRATRAAKGRLSVDLLDENAVKSAWSECVESPTADPIRSWARNSARREKAGHAVHGWISLPKNCQINLMPASNDYEDEPLAA